MTENHPITPPPELVGQWLTEGHHQDYCSATEHAITQAACWGADQELEACANWLADPCAADMPSLAKDLRYSRRPKPPSLKEQALKALTKIEDDEATYLDFSIIRRVLEQLDD